MKRASAFLCAFRGRSYVVTARHVLRSDDIEYRADQVRIPMRDGINAFLSYDHSWEVPTNVELRQEFNDLLLFRLTSPLTADWADDRAPIAENTPAMASATFVSGGDFAVSGYPGLGDNDIDYDADTITNQRFIVQCDYIGPSGKYVHALRAHHKTTFEDFGGFSGAAVIARTDYGLIPAGVVITAGAGHSSIMRFVDAEALYRSLEGFSDQIIP